MTDHIDDNNEMADKRMTNTEFIKELRRFFNKNGYLPWKAAERLIEVAERLAK